MEVSDQFHAPAVFTTGESAPPLLVPPLRYPLNWQLDALGMTIAAYARNGSTNPLLSNL